jgi:hypothetical protein
MDVRFCVILGTAPSGSTREAMNRLKEERGALPERIGNPRQLDKDLDITNRTTDLVPADDAASLLASAVALSLGTFAVRPLLTCVALPARIRDSGQQNVPYF